MKQVNLKPHRVVEMNRMTYTAWTMPFAKTVGIILSALALVTSTIAFPLGLTASPEPVQASTLSQLQQQQKLLQQQQAAKEAQAKQQAAIKAQADAKIKDLGSQIVQVQGNIQQTQADIADTSSTIEQKNQQIAELASQLTALEGQQGALLREMYIMRSSMPDSLVIFSDQPVSDREKEQAQFAALKKSVSTLYLKTTAAKQEVELARSDLVQRNQNLSNLRDQQTAQKQGLASYQQTQAALKSNAEAALKQIDADLLKIRQGEAAAQAALDAAVLAATRNKGSTGGGPGVGSRVHVGDAVGLEGSTGFSTGAHVHYEVRVNGVAVNPQPYLNNGTLAYAFSNYRITQPFGHTSYSYVYAGGIHTGIDFAALSGPGTPLHAPADGTVIYNGCPSGCGSGYGHMWMMELDSGLVVLYGHLQ